MLVRTSHPQRERSNLYLSFNGWPRILRRKLRKLMLLIKLLLKRLDPKKIGYQMQLNLLVVCRTKREKIRIFGLLTVNVLGTCLVKALLSEFVKKAGPMISFGDNNKEFIMSYGKMEIENVIIENNALVDNLIHNLLSVS